MGPFPHDAPRAKLSETNPAGTDGFEFVEFAHPEPTMLDRLFRQMGFEPVAKHKSKPALLGCCGRSQETGLGVHQVRWFRAPQWHQCVKYDNLIDILSIRDHAFFEPESVERPKADRS